MARGTLISISVVSHAQADLVCNAFADIVQFIELGAVEIILTRNVPEDQPVPSTGGHPVTIIDNARPKGFGANHNAAFRKASGQWFCVMNPDIRMTENPFPILIDSMGRLQASVVGPAVLSLDGVIEDSVRRFPSPASLVRKLFGRSDGRYPFTLGAPAFAADWVGGMFMLFRSDDFMSVGGFDEGFFLYYEDVDICARLWKSRRRGVACPCVEGLHGARRTSHRNLRYMRWHVASLARFLAKHWLRLPKATLGQ